MRTRPRAWWGMAMVLAVALVADDGLAQGTSGPGAEERLGVGALAPDFALPDLNGTPVKLSDYRGKKAVFLNFWASWCPTCQEEMPTMEALYRQFHLRGLEILAVSIYDERADVATFMNAHGITFRLRAGPLQTGGDAVRRHHRAGGGAQQGARAGPALRRDHGDRQEVSPWH